MAEERVLHVNDQSGWGGGEHQTFLLIRGLESLGVENHALVRRGGALASRLAGLLPPERLHMLPGAAWPLLPVLARRWLPGMDVVHAHTGRATLAFAGCRGALRVAHRRIPDRPSAAGLRRLARADLVLCVSDLIRARLETWGVGSGGRPRLLTLHSAADLPVTRPQAVPLAGEPVLGFLGHFRRHKGLDLLLEALPAVLGRHPDLVLHLAGEGTEQAFLERRATELGVRARVVFHPLPGDAAAWLAGLDLFVMPSREEGLGSVALLAQALGVPVLATTAGGIPEGVAHGRTGWLVDPGSAAALAEGLALALGDPVRRRDWGSAGPAWVEERFTPEALSRRTLDAYREARA